MWVDACCKEIDIMAAALGKKSRRRMLETDDYVSISPVNKKLNFEPEDEGQDLQELQQFDLELDTITYGKTLDLSGDNNNGKNFSPCRTRSGVVYESGLKRKKVICSTANRRRPKKEGRRSRTNSGRSGTGSLADCSENESGDDQERLSDNVMADLSQAEERLAPPPLNYCKNPVSRFSLSRERPADFHEMLSSPTHSFMNHAQEDGLSPIKRAVWNQSRCHLQESPLQSPSPPTNTMRAMRLFDPIVSPNTACAISSPQSTPRVLPLKSRLLFTEDGEPRRSSYPAFGQQSRRNMMECDSTSSVEKAKQANINPFTPSAMLAAATLNRRNKSSTDKSFSPRPRVPPSDAQTPHGLDVLSDPGSEDEETGRFSPLPAKRVRVSDINITRYQEEFLELAEIASGSFGMVKQARHRLDGIVYAIKITKNRLRVNSHDEKMAMNEVFAHAALMKHRHVVRYFNSWVEKGQVYIQNEFCDGGTLQKQIEDHRRTGQPFSEADLRRILMHIAKGLHYIHINQLAHLDIKPGNILITTEYGPTPTPSPIREQDQSDSGAASGDLSPRNVNKHEPSSCESSPGEQGDRLIYKIGDLGHVFPVQDEDYSPEEGDCRYMAPEFLEMEQDRSKLPKADIFSLGCTIYEAASLRNLPRNSTDASDYHDIKNGKLEYLVNYSEDFNNMLTKMVSKDPNARPTALKLINNCDINAGINKTKHQLSKELKETREKLMFLEAQLSAVNENSKRVAKRKLVGRGTAKADSFQL